MLRSSVVSSARHASRGLATFQPTKYGGKYTATLIPGDGIGREVADSVKEIFAATNAPVEFEEVDVTGILAAEGTKDGSEQLYRKAVESLRRNKVGLKGILYTPLERSGHASFNVAIRQELDLYASTVFIKNFPGLKTRHDGIDAVIIRENTEGEYSGLEQQAVPGVVEALKVITRAKSERIARFAFDFAQRNDRKKITVIHKANIMKLADGLFRDVFYETAKDYPEIQANDMIVDNASMQAVSKPQQFDVMLMPNLYGSILSNVMGGLVGGPGLIPGCNIGRDYALFEPGCRHVGLDIKGKDEANPLAMILSSCMLLRHLGLDNFANAIAKAAYAVIEEGKVRTRDMKGTSTTHDMTKAILDKIEL
ncbi:isocitrate dehydrogenase (NAD(+)) idh1 [Savitreella phatthalungensis]